MDFAFWSFLLFTHFQRKTYGGLYQQKTEPATPAKKRKRFSPENEPSTSNN